LTVDQIDNLAAAFHYFVWPLQRVDHGMGNSFNEVIEAIQYAKRLNLESLQIDLLYVRVAMFVSPKQTMWKNKHERASEEYADSKSTQSV
jgi:hypothetical protein